MCGHCRLGSWGAVPSGIPNFDMESKIFFKGIESIPICLFRRNDLRSFKLKPLNSKCAQLKRGHPRQAMVASVREWLWRHQTSDNWYQSNCFWTELWYFLLKYRSVTDVISSPGLVLPWGGAWWMWTTVWSLKFISHSNDPHTGYESTWLQQQ